MAWLFLTLFAPTVGPLVVSWIFWRISKNPNAHPMMLVKDGQLGWTAIAVCSMAIYELVEQERTASIWSVVYGVTILLAMVVALAGPLKPVALTDKDKPAFWMSLYFFGLSSVLAFAEHLTFHRH